MILNAKKRIKKQQLIVLAGACLFQLALLGTFANCVGTLTAQMRTQFHISMTEISLYNTIRSVTSAALASVLTGMFYRIKKPLFMTANNLVLILSFLLLIPGGNRPLLLTSAILHGSTFSVSAIMIVDVLKKWFPGNLGFATGLAMMFSGLGGAVFNPLIAVLLGRYGWSATIVMVSLITLSLTLAGVCMIFSQKDLGERKTQSASTTGEPHTLPSCDAGNTERWVFPLCCMAILGGATALQFNNYVTIFAQSVGYSLTVGASLTSMVMVGNIAGKVVFGVGCDRIGIWKTMAVALTSVIAALVCFIHLSGHLIALYVASVLFGFVFALFMMSICQFSAPVFGEERSARQIGALTGINNLLNATAALGIGTIYDSTQAFGAALYLILAACVVSLLAVIALNGYAARRKKTNIHTINQKDRGNQHERLNTQGRIPDKNR